MSTNTQNAPPAQCGTPAAPGATPAPATGQAQYTPEHAAHIIAERAKWLALGFDGKDFDDMCPPPAPFTARGVSNRLEVQDKNRDFATPELAERMAAALLRSGVSQERIDAARAADAGLSTDEKPAEMSETRTPELVEYDKSFGMDREYKPGDYRLNLAPEIKARGLDHMRKFQASATEFLASSGINPGIGAALVEHAVKRGQAFSKATDAEQKLWKMEQKYAGLRACGGSQAKLDETVALAAQTLKRAINHGSSAALEAEALSQSAASHDWYVIKILAAQAEHYNRWQAGRPGKKTS